MSRERKRSGESASTEADGSTTLTVLVRRALGLSHGKARALVVSGAVAVDGEVETDPACRPAAGRRVVADPSRAARRPVRLEGPGFRIVHLDRAIAVVDKAPGVVTIPTSARREDESDPSLVALVAGALRAAGHRQRDLYVVHRIDRETSGLVLFARSARSASRLRAQFRRRSPEREYLAWTEGVPHPGEGTLRHLLAEEEGSHRMRVVAAGAGGKHAVLSYRVEARAGDRAARVRVRLETGRRNQIRVQFTAAGWPVAGDRYYGASTVGPGRTALHAARLAFEHPTTGERVEQRVGPPADLLAFDRALFGPQALTKT